MNVKVNGEPQSLPDGTTVRGVVEHNKLSVDKVAVELNRRLVRTAQYDRVLQENDEIEIVTFVGGG
jgi:thiamine biosynthesis protein ThiS